MKKYILVLLLVILIVPSVVSASWWNPFTWKIFNKQIESKIEQPVIDPVDQTVEIEKLKKEVEDLKKINSQSLDIDKNIKNQSNLSTQMPSNSIPSGTNSALNIAKCQASAASSKSNYLIMASQALDGITSPKLDEYKKQIKEIEIKATDAGSAVLEDPALKNLNTTELIKKAKDAYQPSILYLNQKIVDLEKIIENEKEKNIRMAEKTYNEQYQKCLEKY